MTTETWNNNHIQFPRLLAEIMATQDNLDMAALATSMDLTVEDVSELFDRAQDEWEAIKQGTSAAAEDATLTINLNIFDDEGNVVDGTTADLSVSSISDIIDHASQLVLLKREGQDEEADAVLAELEDALVVADVIAASE